MAKTYDDHIRSLALLHDDIEQDQEIGEKAAIEKVVKDVHAAARKIAADAERVVDQLNADAKQAADGLKAEAKQAVTGIRKGAAQAASDLISQVEEGADKKTAVLKASKILKDAEQTTVELNRQATVSLDALEKQTEAASAEVNAAVKSALVELLEIKEQAVKQLAGTAKGTAQQFLADTAPEDPETRAARQSAAQVIKMLAQASESVTRSVGDATARVQRAAEKALANVKVASSQASTSVHDAIDAANNKVLDVAETAITKQVGESEAEFFDVGSLRDRWKKRDS